MVIVPGIVFSNEINTSTSGKKVAKLSLVQKEIGFIPIIVTLDIWEDNELFADVCSLSDGEMVHVKCNSDVKENKIRYFPKALTLI